MEPNLVDGLLVHRYEQGETMTAIAKTLGVSGERVRQRIVRYEQQVGRSIPRSKVTKAAHSPDAILRVLRAQLGIATQKELARVIGCHHTTLRGYMTSEGKAILIQRRKERRRNKDRYRLQGLMAMLGRFPNYSDLPKTEYIGLVIRYGTWANVAQLVGVDVPLRTGAQYFASRREG